MFSTIDADAAGVAEKASTGDGTRHAPKARAAIAGLEKIMSSGEDRLL